MHILPRSNPHAPSHIRRIQYLMAGVLALFGLSASQTEVYKPYQNTWIWSADSLYVGASFIYLDAGKPIIVTFKANAAGWMGSLFAINPATADTVFLFTNNAIPGTSVNLSALTAVPVGTELVFLYKVTSLAGCCGLSALDRLPKFSGPNRGTDKYFSPASSDMNIIPNYRFGHRWSVVGKIPGDKLEFGFEDMASSPTSDMDFDDIVFQVSGLALGVYTRTLDKKNFVW